MADPTPKIKYSKGFAWIDEFLESLEYLRETKPITYRQELKGLKKYLSGAIVDIEQKIDSCQQPGHHNQ